MKKTSRPPRIFSLALEGLIQPEDRESLPGDFEEMYNRLASTHGVMLASLWYFAQLLKLLPVSFYHSTIWGGIMLRNYLKIALRNLLRHKLYSFINVWGLALGIAGAIVILLIIQNEFGYDRHQEKGDRIYALFQYWDFGGYQVNDASVAPAMAPALQEDYPEIVETVRCWRWRNPLIHYQQKQFYETAFVFADPSVLTSSASLSWRAIPKRRSLSRTPWSSKPRSRRSTSATRIPLARA